MYSVGLRYCGGCNPEIDRPGLIDHLKEGIEKRGIIAEFITDKETATDLILLINGCKHACLEQKYLTGDQNPPIISVRGEMVGDKYFKEKDIPEFLVGKIIGEID
jgi:hypothetical protein